MAKKIGVLKWLMSDVEHEIHKISTLDGKVDSIETIDLHNRCKTKYQRWDISKNKSYFEKVLYIAAKRKPREFQNFYYDLKKSDSEFFEIAEKVLKKIQAEYNFE